jgi:hypothetical protein
MLPMPNVRPLPPFYPTLTYPSSIGIDEVKAMCEKERPDVLVSYKERKERGFMGWGLIRE